MASSAKMPLKPIVFDLMRGRNAKWVGKTELFSGHQANLRFSQDADGLKVSMPNPPKRPCDFAYVLKITGLKLSNPVQP